MNRKERRNINRANAQHSTGPVTAEGKTSSSQNALKHGLTSMKPYLPAEEQDYTAYAAERRAVLNSKTTSEADLAQTIIDIEWRLRRIPCLEARLFENEEADPHKIIRSLDVLSRHEGRLRKQLQAAMMDLQAAIVDRCKIQEANHKPTSLNPIGFVLKSATPPTLAAVAAASEAAVKYLSAPLA